MLAAKTVHARSKNAVVKVSVKTVMAKNSLDPSRSSGLDFFSLRSKDPWRGTVPKTHENQSASGVLYFLYPSRSLKRASFAYGHKKNQRKTLVFRCLCGERGIRTPGTLRYAGFQDQCIRPLCHLSDEKLLKLLEWAANLNRN